MSPRIRLLIAALATVVLAMGGVVVLRHMPDFGAHPSPYGDAINHSAIVERHVTNMVTAVNFDYRAIDTVGEEFMLIAAVTGTLVLLRGRRGENVSDVPAPMPGYEFPPRREALTAICRLFLAITWVFGWYVVLHPQLTPGGGFQGGAILGSGALLVYLGEDYRTWRRLIRSRLFDMIEAAGALILGLSGFAALFTHDPLFTNNLPLGRTKAMLSGGLILVENAGVALAVGAGFVLVLLEFLEETRAPKGNAS